MVYSLFSLDTWFLCCPQRAVSVAKDLDTTELGCVEPSKNNTKLKLIPFPNTVQLMIDKKLPSIYEGNLL